MPKITDVNSIVVSGRVFGELANRTTGTGKFGAKFTLETRHLIKGDSIPMHIGVFLYEENAHLAMKHLKPGTHVTVSGSLVTEKTRSGGLEVTTFRILVHKFTFVPAGDKNE